MMVVDEIRSRASNAAGVVKKGAGTMADGARSAGRKAHDVADDGRIGVMTILPQARETAEQIAERVPELVERARGSAFETKKTFDKMDDPTLREVAAGSLGLAAGLYVAGAPRLIVLAAATPGIFAAAAMATRRPAGRTR
jgi:hypothetical protein